MMPTSFTALLQPLAEGQPLRAEQRQQLAIATLTHPTWATAFGMTPETIDAIMTERAQYLPQVYPAIQLLWQQQHITTPCLELLWFVWLPLALRLIAARQQLERPWIQGILGMQGAGKSTLTAVLCILLNQLGYPSGTLSIDDLYKTYAERQQLQQQDPRLIWRGPPGTHDVALGIEILDQLRHSDPQTRAVQVPRFDKSCHSGQGDRSGFEPFPAAEIVFFEGWFVGMHPLNPNAFDQPLPPILTPADQQFALDINEQLQQYVSLWERLDALLVLKLTDYHLSKQWRREAEHKAIAAGRGGMSDAEINQFVDYFWRALHPELFLPALVQQADCVIEVDANRQITSIRST